MKWISAPDRLPDITAGSFSVRDAKDREFEALFYEDAMGWIAKYGLKPTNWWRASRPHDPIYNVTHWDETK